MLEDEKYQCLSVKQFAAIVRRSGVCDEEKPKPKETHSFRDEADTKELNSYMNLD